MHVPGWYNATSDWLDSNEFQMVGIIQEQHPDRARLFMQWKQMDWPILVDSFNLLDIDVVPLTLAIDEYGIVRHAGLPVAAANTIEGIFLNKTYEKPTGLTARRIEYPNSAELQKETGTNTAEAWRDYATSLVLPGSTQRIDEAIDAYQRSLGIDPDHGPTHFRLGVAYRMRYDSTERRPDDFARAVEQWQTALDINPNQYIWRRRIQQYGPRLAKPYPFYDWVTLARAEIGARGETPSPLRIEPGDSEFAVPTRRFVTEATADEEPDPEGRILRDSGEFIQTETVAVPPTMSAGGSTRVHITFRPNLSNKAHWNNEVDGLAFWINTPEGWSVNQQYLTLANPPGVVSQEQRTIEFEIQSPQDATGATNVSAYALYYVCEDVNGICMYRRQDVDVRLEVKK